MPPDMASGIRGKRKSAARRLFPTPNWSLLFASFLDEAVFNGEGDRKLWARLRHQGIRTFKDRVLQLLRENQLLSPARHPEPVRSNPHEGTIQATRFEALQPIRQGVKEQFGAFSGGIAAGL